MRALPPASAEEQHRGAVAPGGAGDDMGGCDWARRRRILRVTVPPRGARNVHRVLCSCLRGKQGRADI